jgi:hypothetical protein
VLRKYFRPKSLFKTKVTLKSQAGQEKTTNQNSILYYTCGSSVRALQMLFYTSAIVISHASGKKQLVVRKILLRPGKKA